MGASCHERVVIGASRYRSSTGSHVHLDQPCGVLRDGGDPPIAHAEILPFDLPLHGVVGTLGVGLAAFLVMAALAGRAVAPPTSQGAAYAGGSRCAGTWLRC